MPLLNVCGIHIEFNYVFPDYFEPQIKDYISNSEDVKYRMNVEVVSTIPPIKNKPVLASYKNRFVYDDDTHHIIAIYDKNNQIIQLIKHTTDYLKIDIQLREDLNKNLPEIEYVLSGLLFVELSLLEGKMALHGSAIKTNDKGLIFSASSGTGKTTHTNHWIEKIDNTTIINDDKPLLFFKGDTPYVGGSPWCGKDSLNTNLTTPLDIIVFLKQGQTNTIRSLSNKEIITNLLKHTIRPRNLDLMDQTLSIIEKISQTVEIIEYSLQEDQSSFYTLYTHIFGGNYED